MTRQNCWDAKRCGREAGGPRVAELGVCPASTERRLDGVNRGANAGRACWGLVGTLCHGQVQGHFAQKISTCLSCDVFKQVEREEWPDYVGTSKILSLLG